jgi:LacI family transcriptional regulator
MSKRITIKDVAKKAGTSYQTVSRVINNKPDVSTKTRERVLEVIEELNYRPSMAATSRTNPKTQIMAIAISPYNEFLLYEGDPHLLRIIQGIDLAIEPRNYSLLLSTIHCTNDGEIKSRLLNRQIADGVIIRLSKEDKGATAKLLAERGYPVVVLGYSEHPDIPAIRSDDEHGGFTQTQHLLALGHQKIGIISGPIDDPATTKRREGHERAMITAGFDPVNTPIVPGDYTDDSGYKAVAKLIVNHPDITAIIAFNDMMAIGAIHWLHQKGINVPEEISVVGYDDILDAQCQVPALTTIKIPSLEEGQQAVKVLFDLIENRPLNSRKFILPVHLITRESTTVPRKTVLNNYSFNNFENIGQLKY